MADFYYILESEGNLNETVREEYDIRKSPSDPARAESVTAGALNSTASACADLAQAFAEAFRRFAFEVDPQTGKGGDLPSNLYFGILASNARFFDELGRAWNKMYDRAVQPKVVVQIDYERLAKLVADEISKRQRPQAVP